MNRQELCRAARGACLGLMISLTGSLPSLSASADDASRAVRRLPPITAGAATPTAGQRPKKSASSETSKPANSVEEPPIADHQHEHRVTSDGSVQRTSAVEPATSPAAAKLPVRRLPPLADGRLSATRRKGHQQSPAHLAEEVPGTRDGVSRVLAGSYSIAHRTVYLGAAPQPATDSDLPDLGRATLRPAGPLPRDLKSPAAIMPAR